MSDPTLLYCVGATKAGTSWLYRHLHEHPECHVPAVKEAHYWDTFDTEDQTKQVEIFKTRLANFHVQRDEAAAKGINWQVANFDRRISDMSGLIDALEGDREGDLGYAGWLLNGHEDMRLVADMTPGYALLPGSTLKRMTALSPTAKFVYLIRDPLARMWSHIRMQAKRYRQDHEVFEVKANNILRRVVLRDKETHIMARGDYATTIARLRRVIPKGRLLVMFCETLFTADGWRTMSDFLGLTYKPVDAELRVHEGPTAPMDDDLLIPAIEFLKDQYDWVAQHMGPLPAAWQENRARIAA